MRAFIAITLPDAVREALSRLQEKLKTSRADVKWVEPEQIHLTIKFLGEIDDGSLDEVKMTLDTVAGRWPGFDISLSALGSFPRPESPRIIWVGINGGSGPLQSLVQDLENYLIRIGIPKEERPFSAHITLGRTRSTDNLKNLIQSLAALKQQPDKQGLAFPVAKLTLFKSTLTPKGPVYEIVQESSLKTT